MKTIISLILIGLALVGCSTAVLTTAKPQETATSVSALAKPTAKAVTEDTSSLVKPSFSMTAGPPAILLVPGKGKPADSFPTPTPISLEGWQTFTSAALHIALNYPSDWSVTEQTNGATFASPAGASISLQSITPNGTNSENQQCITLITAYGQTANLCVKSDMYSAEFNLQLANGSPESLMISTTNSNVLDVYKEMFNSLHPIQ
ncbi:MAG: hypothetical protein WBW94_07525 [Anaerolineales bacterium]